MNFDGSVVRVSPSDSKTIQSEGPADMLHPHHVSSTELSQQELVRTGDSFHLKTSVSTDEHISVRPRASSELEALRSLKTPEG